MRLRFSFADQDFTATLEDNPSARDLFSMLPLDLTISDYSTNEKIAYLPRKLTEDGSGSFGNEAVGDICYYAPWGNLALFSWAVSLVARPDPARPPRPGSQAAIGARRVSAARRNPHLKPPLIKFSSQVPMLNTLKSFTPDSWSRPRPRRLPSKLT